MKITVGQKAPEFSLYNSEKNKISLVDQKGKNVVLLFFPQAFTSVCTAELCNVRDNLAFYNNTNAEVFGISVDSIFTLAKFKEEQKLNFPLLSDFNKEVSGNYDALIRDFVFDMHGVSKRAAFVIDKEGVVQYAEVLDKVSDQPNFNEIQETLKRLN
ncbi:redoxin domain-containing protein [Flavihumibacter fluvii]|uniref:redoxin domain-containing protein n=1 Tax=Flavihumibacter fluvii TaxID=2838157 RepID=UPI001BDF1481|nr:peroxiredoxin [Flavihumibacter fluvii]ULQ50662.1 peroxiredoxin [Flavihumibacter fluvii]